VKRIRKLHLYLGTLFAPSIIFFAFTGALQTLGLHESRSIGSEPPPRWIMTLAEVHKNQRLSKPKPVEAVSHEKVPNLTPLSKGHTNPDSAILALKWFVLLMAAGLIIEAALGIYMALKYNRDKRIVYGLLVVGIALPIALLLS
jgi:hypothetical protein